MTLWDQEPQLRIQHNRKQINSSNFVGVLNQGLATLGGRLGRNISQDGWVQSNKETFLTMDSPQD